MTPPPEGQTESEGLKRHYGWDKLIPADSARETMGEEHANAICDMFVVFENWPDHRALVECFSPIFSQNFLININQRRKPSDCLMNLQTQHGKQWVKSMRKAYHFLYTETKRNIPRKTCMLEKY